MPELIKEGHVYISMPPLYKFTHGKNSVYVKSTEELNKLTKGKTNFNVQRFKGLKASPFTQKCVSKNLSNSGENLYS